MEARATGVVAALGVLIASVAARAAPDDAEAQGAVVRAKPGVLEALLDCRSPTLPHESRVRFGTPWPCAGELFTFDENAAGRIVVARRGAGESASGGGKTLSALPALFLFETRGLRMGISVRREGDETAVRVSSAWGLPIKVGRATAHLVDSDRNAVLGTQGDGYVAPESRTVAPWTGEVWARDVALRVAQAKDVWHTTAVPAPHPEDADHAAAWRLVQWRRQQCGLLPLRYDPTVEASIRAHAAYCARNAYHGHDEDPAAPGYTAEGHQAGRASVLGYGVDSALDGMEEQLATLYHRSQVLSPALQAAGFVVHAGVFGMNVRKTAGGPLADRPLVYPPHGMRNVRRRFSDGGESPSPVLTLTRAHDLGTSIAVFLPALERVESLPRAPTLTVDVLGRRGRVKKALRSWIRYPGRPPKTGIGVPNGGNISFTPRGRLDAKTTFRGRVDALLPSGDAFRYEWEFTTGR